MQTLTLTVGELNEYVRRTLAGDPMLHGVKLKGELSNFKRHASGHWYFTLKDSESAISCAMFRSAATGVTFAPHDGQQVVLTGSVGLYAKTGTYQFYADAMQLDGVGELYLRMEALKKKLEKEGLFDPALKKPLPLLPRGIGVATSGTGAVIHDIARVTWRRDPGMPIYLCPVAVQGNGAAEQIAEALALLDRLHDIDVIIVGRGGGSMEDLWPFNEEVVARAIVACHKPVVSAVGHETDFTIADFVADLRAPTPSAAAELAVPARDALRMQLEQLENRLARATENGLTERIATLAQLRKRMAEHTPENMLNNAEARLEAVQLRMYTRMDANLTRAEHRISETALRLRTAGPAATLARGYAMVRQGEQTVQRLSQIRRDQPMTVIFHDGQMAAQPLRLPEEE